MKWQESGEGCIMKLQDLYSSPCIIRMIKSWLMRWTGHVGGMGEDERVVGY
jgi:hypothetical protein